MRNLQDRTFDHDAITQDTAENLALREALMILGHAARKLRSADLHRRASRAMNTDLSRIH